jgi:hypothetical protein
LHFVQLQYAEPVVVTTNSLPNTLSYVSVVAAPPGDMQTHLATVKANAKTQMDVLMGGGLNMLQARLEACTALPAQRRCHLAGHRRSLRGL